MSTDFNRWLVLAIVGGGLSLIGVDMTVLNVALPILVQELGATNAEKLWMVNAYSLTLAGLLPGCGALSDRIGHRKMFVLGLVIFGVSSTIAAYSRSPTQLIIARGVLAIGAAMILPATIAIVRTTFVRDEERAIAIGIWGSITAGAAALGPVLGGFLLKDYWWGSVFLVNVPIVVVTLGLALVKIPAIPGNPNRHWDATSSALLTVLLITLLYAVKSVLKTDIHWPHVAIATIAVASFLWWFLKRQETLPTPIIDFTLFRDLKFAIGTASAFWGSFAMLGTQYLLSQELQLVRSFTPLETGLYLLPIAVGAFVAGPLLGAVLFKVGIGRMLWLALTVAAVGFVLYTITASHPSIALQVLALSLVGFGLGGTMSVGSTSIMLNAPDEMAGVAGAIEGISYEMGGTVGVAVMGSIVASIYAHKFNPPLDSDLPVAAWDSLEQTLIAVDNLSPIQVEQVLETGRQAFQSGTFAILVGTSLATLVLALIVALLGNKFKDADATIFEPPEEKSHD